MKTVKVAVTPRLVRAMNLNTKKLEKAINKAVRASGVGAVVVKYVDKEEKNK